MGEVFALELTERQRLVLLALADHAADNGTGARPGIDRLRWKTDLKRRTVERILSQLRSAGIIEKVSGGGHRQAVEYKINLSAGQKKPPFGANDETETAANLMADERKPAKRKSAANLMADEPANELPEKNESAAKNGNNQPPNSTHSAANQMAYQPSGTANEPNAFSSSAENAMSPFSGENDDAPVSTVGKILGRAVGRGDPAKTANFPQRKEIFNVWKRTFDATRADFHSGDGYDRTLWKRFNEGLTAEQMSAAIKGFALESPELQTGKKTTNFQKIFGTKEDVLKFAQIFDEQRRAE